MKNEISSYLNLLASKAGSLTVGLLGIGKTNTAILEILLNCDAVREIRLRQASDDRLSRFTADSRVRILASERERSDIDEDILFVSPSVRREKLNVAKGTLITSDNDLFFGKKRENCFLISGSDGKSTTTTLTVELLKDVFPSLFVGGNLGTPLADSDTASTDAFVIEMSSFSLRYLTPRSKRALITCITPNHLDWHENYEEYVEAKKNVLKLSDEPVINVDTGECQRIAMQSPLFAVCSSIHSLADLKGRYKAEHFVTVRDGLYLDGEKILELGEVRMRERHNLSNLASAIAITSGFVSRDTVREAAMGFGGLAHRCEVFLATEGVRFIDSSIDTTPERTRVTLESLDSPVRILLGGRAKGLPLEPIKDPLIRYARRIAVYGDAADEMLGFIEGDTKLRAIPHAAFPRLGEAVDYLTVGLTEGESVILSPAATSYGEFKSYAERGEQFKQIILDKYTKI